MTCTCSIISLCLQQILCFLYLCFYIYVFDDLCTGYSLQSRCFFHGLSLSVRSLSHSTADPGLELQKKQCRRYIQAFQDTGEPAGSRGGVPVGGPEDEFLQNVMPYGYFGRDFCSKVILSLIHI